MILQDIPSFLNGISQQAPSVRHVTQAEAQLNAHSNMSRGLTKRPPLVRVKNLLQNQKKTLTDKGVFVHYIPVSGGGLYILLIMDGSVSVFNAETGDLIKVTLTPQRFWLLPEGTQRKTNSRVIDVRMVNSETNFYPNTKIHGNGEMEWCLASNKEMTDAVILRTDHGHNGAAELVTKTSYYVQARWTPDGASDTCEAWVDIFPGWYFHSNTPDKSFRARTVADTTFIVNREVTVELEDQVGYSELAGKVQTFGDLPVDKEDNEVPNGVVYEILGERGSGWDNYFVKRDGKMWVETTGPGSLKNTLRRETMPFRLIRRSDDCELKFGGWGSRLVGDERSAPNPPFVGQEIQEVFFFKDRLGFCSGDHVCLSRVGTASGGYFSFWPEATNSALETDPVFRVVPLVKASQINHALEFDQAMLLFADDAQYELRGSDRFSPKTAKVDQSTQFESEDVRPYGSGSFVYFVQPKGSYAGIREYHLLPASINKGAEEISAHVARYIPSDVACITGTTSPDTLFVLSKKAGERKKIYVNSFAWNEQTKIQNSWSHWHFENTGDILHIHATEGTLHVLSVDNGRIYLSKLFLNSEQDEMDMDRAVCLDERTCVRGEYDSVTGRTVFAVPFARNQLYTLVTGKDFPGGDGAFPKGVATEEFVSRNNIRKQTSSSGQPVAWFSGDYSAADCYLGFTYEMRYELSKQFRRPVNSDGSTGLITGGHLLIKKLSIDHAATDTYTVEVKADTRKARSMVFDSQDLGSQTAAPGDYYAENGTFTCAVMASTDNLRIILKQATWRPATWISANWIGLFSGKAVLGGSL